VTTEVGVGDGAPVPHDLTRSLPLSNLGELAQRPPMPSRAFLGVSPAGTSDERATGVARAYDVRRRTRDEHALSCRGRSLVASSPALRAWSPNEPR